MFQPNAPPDVRTATQGRPTRWRHSRRLVFARVGIENRGENVCVWPTLFILPRIIACSLSKSAAPSLSLQLSGLAFHSFCPTAFNYLLHHRNIRHIITTLFPTANRLLLYSPNTTCFPQYGSSPNSLELMDFLSKATTAFRYAYL